MDERVERPFEIIYQNRGLISESESGSRNGENQRLLEILRRESQWELMCDCVSPR